MTLALALSALAASPQQPALEGEARRFAQAWARRDGTALESMMRAGGVRLHLLGEEHGSVPPRQGRAALLELMQRHPGGDPRVGRVAAAEGDARKGFAELRVETRAPGALAPVILTVFVGFALEGAGWVVTEVRVLG
jgi:hypothetical protein